MKQFSSIDFEDNDLKKIVENGDYDQLRAEIDEAYHAERQSEAVKRKIVAISSATFTIGIVSFLLRAGSLVAGMMSTMPLWRGFDPIAVYAGKKKEKKKQNEIPDSVEQQPEAVCDRDSE